MSPFLAYCCDSIALIVTMHRTSYKRPYAKERCIHDIRDQNHRGSADTHIEIEKPVARLAPVFITETLVKVRGRDNI